jgi:hypothetical protein
MGSVRGKLLLGLALMLGWVPMAHGQVLPRGNGREPLLVTLESVDNEVPVLGSAGGTASANLGTPGVFGGGPLSFDIGFNYIRPFSSSSAFNVRFPARPGAVQPDLGAAGDLTSDFTFMPRILVGYQVTPDGYGLAVSGEFLNLSGYLDRTLAVGAVAAKLNATSNLTIVYANLVEGMRSIPGTELNEHCGLVSCLGLDEAVFHMTLGTRYASVEQHYKGTIQVTSSNDASELTADQSFAGFGLTSSLYIHKPVTQSWSVFWGVRGSVLFGRNHKQSSATFAVDGDVATGNLTEEKTYVVPIGETEFGFEWGTPIKHSIAGQQAGPLVFLRVGCVGQVIGNVGLLTVDPVAGPGVSRFSNQPLFLAGVGLQAGIDF